MTAVALPWVALSRSPTSPPCPNHTPKDPDHPSAGVALDRLGDLSPSGKTSRAVLACRCEWLAKHLERLLRVAGEAVGAKQQALECPTSANTNKERRIKCRSRLFAPHRQAKAATDRNAEATTPPTDDPDTQLIGLNLPQEHSSGLNEVFVNPPALRPLSRCQRRRYARPKEGRNDCLRRAAVASRVTMVTINSCGLCAR